MILPIILLIIAAVLLVLAGVALDDDSLGPGICCIALACIFTTFSIVIMVENVTMDIDAQVKTKVLQHLTYTKDVTLVPDTDGKFFYELNTPKHTDLFSYITTDKYNNLREVQ